MSKVEPRVLKGFRDYLPDMMVPRERMLRDATAVFESFGFAPLATPAIEYTDILLGKYGTEGDKLLYRFKDNGERDVSLRYDLTVPLARVVGQYPELAKPFRRYQVAPVWRAEKPGRGRFREFVQCDVDIVGSTSLLADFECIQVAVAVLRRLGVVNFKVRINDRRILDGLMARIGITERKRVQEVLRVVDKLPKVGWGAVDDELRDALGMDETCRSRICEFLKWGDLNDVYDKDIVDRDIAKPGVDSLLQLLDWATALGIRDYLDLDLSIARGLDYYTSTIYETFLTDLAGFGSVMSGGRYDGLVGMFSKNDVPAVGISLGVDRLLAGLIELGKVDSSASAADVYVTVFDAERTGYAQRVAAGLRAAGLRVQLHLEVGQKLGKQFGAAEKAGARFAVVAGPDEAETGAIAVKDLRAGEQSTMPLGDAATWIAARSK